MRTIFALLFLAALPSPLHAQMIDDGIMINKGTLFTGTIYVRDTWDEYWEGTLKRTNGNIGEITTQTNVFYADYGLTRKLNIIGSVPYIRTRASQGVLHGDRGFQDLTLAAKYAVVDTTSPKFGTVRLIGVLSGGIPMRDYNPELLPLSIGFGSKRLAARGTAFYRVDKGIFVMGTSAYNWRGETTLDRPYYFTEDTFTTSDKVDLPNASDTTLMAGYQKRNLMAAGTFTVQRTLGGGDIRRQDMPFVSNRMNFSRAGAMVMYPVPKVRDLSFMVTYGYTLDGRNVGQSSTFTGALFYAIGSRPR